MATALRNTTPARIRCQDCLRPIRKGQETGDYRGTTMHAACAQRLNAGDDLEESRRLAAPLGIIIHHASV